MTRDSMMTMFGPKPCRTCGRDHYRGPCPPAPEYRAPTFVSPHRHHARHAWAQPGDRPERVWLLRFDDTDQRDMIWLGDDAEALAVEAYRLYAPTWNCTLLASVPASALTFPAENSASQSTEGSAREAPAEPNPPSKPKGELS